MSRFLELTVRGEHDEVADCAVRAFRSIGRVRNSETSSIDGVIKIDGYPADVTVAWKPGRDAGYVCLDISATSDDTLSQAADSALYAFARAYKNYSLHGPEIERMARLRRRITIGVLVAAALIAGFLYLRLRS